MPALADPSPTGSEASPQVGDTPVSCGAADGGYGPPAAGLKALPISVGPMPGPVLLGLNGERVPARSAPVWVDDAGLPQTWMDKVDWPVYRAAGNMRTFARLHLDADGRLCRVDDYTFHDPRDTAGAQPAPAGLRLEYDGSGRFIGYARYEQMDADDYELVERACLRRDEQGRPQALLFGECEDGVGLYYVRDAAGRLLRAIDRRFAGEAVAVHTFDEQGQVERRYALSTPPWDEADAPRLPHRQFSSEDRPLVIMRSSLETLHAEESPGNDWRIVLLPEQPEGDDEDMSSWDPADQTVLASGRSDDAGLSVLPTADQEKIWQAMHESPGRVYWYPNPMTRVLLLPAMPPEQWRACSDPANANPDACG